MSLFFRKSLIVRRNRVILANVLDTTRTFVQEYLTLVYSGRFFLIKRKYSH